jgi:hypothetical protein
LPWQAFVRCSGCGQERASARACSACSRQLIFQRAADGRETALRPVQRHSVATGAAVVRLFLFSRFSALSFRYFCVPSFSWLPIFSRPANSSAGKRMAAFLLSALRFSAGRCLSALFDLRFRPYFSLHFDGCRFQGDATKRGYSFIDPWLRRENRHFCKCFRKPNARTCVEQRVHPSYSPVRNCRRTTLIENVSEIIVKRFKNVTLIRGGKLCPTLVNRRFTYSFF